MSAEIANAVLCKPPVAVSGGMAATIANSVGVITGSGLDSAKRGVKITQPILRSHGKLIAADHERHRAPDPRGYRLPICDPNGGIESHPFQVFDLNTEIDRRVWVVIETS